MKNCKIKITLRVANLVKNSGWNIISKKTLPKNILDAFYEDYSQICEAIHDGNGFDLIIQKGLKIAGVKVEQSLDLVRIYSIFGQCLALLADPNHKYIQTVLIICDSITAEAKNIFDNIRPKNTHFILQELSIGQQKIEENIFSRDIDESIVYEPEEVIDIPQIDWNRLPIDSQSRISSFVNKLQNPKFLRPKRCTKCENEYLGGGFDTLCNDCKSSASLLISDETNNRFKYDGKKKNLGQEEIMLHILVYLSKVRNMGANSYTIQHKCLIRGQDYKRFGKYLNKLASSGFIEEFLEDTSSKKKRNRYRILDKGMSLVKTIQDSSLPEIFGSLQELFVSN